MSDRLLSELFPRFVKKSQLEHLAKGPFGEGLLEKQGKRVYLKPGEQAPEGVQVQTGARGGQYYDEPGGGGAAQPATDEDGFPVGSSPTGEERRAKREEAVANLGQQQAAGQTSPPDVSEPTFDGQGNIQLPGSDPMEVSELLVTGDIDSEGMSHLNEEWQKAGGYGDMDDLLSGYDGPLTVDGVQDYLVDQQQQARYDREVGPSDDDIASATDFIGWLEDQAGSGPNPQTLDSPDGLDWERSGFDQEDFHEAIIDAQGSVHNTEMGYSGAQNWMEENGIDINSPLGHKLYDYADRYSRERAQDAADYYGEDYALMEKMMQKYNVDNKRRDPIVLSNKGGRQR